MEVFFTLLGSFLLTGVLVFCLFMVYKLERDKNKKYMRLYDEMYIYYKNINKGE